MRKRVERRGHKGRTTKMRTSQVEKNPRILIGAERLKLMKFREFIQ